MLLFLTATIVFLVDPYQHYRKATFYKPYSLDQRHMVWGLLKNYEYDSVLIGTSMTGNFRKDYVDNDLNLNILRVPFDALSAYETNLLIQKSVENKKLTTVVYGLDFFSFKGKKTRHGGNSLPTYLMNNIFTDDYKYLLNIDTFFKDSVKIFLSNYLGIKKERIDFNIFWNWDFEQKFNKELYIERYNDNLKINSKNEYTINDLKKSFDYNISSHYKKNKEIEFIVFLPPYSILFWKSLEYKNYLKDILEFREYVLRQSIKHKNVKIYDLQIAKDITNNLDNYIDSIHYSGDINRWIIKQIKKDNYLVTKENFNKHLARLKAQIQDYDLDNILYSNTK
jgi:hypothetical protein